MSSVCEGVILPGDSPPETGDEETLVLLAKEGEEEAFSRLVAFCGDIIRCQTARLRGGWLEPEDLAQEGLLGLLSAVHAYQPENGASFRTFAQVCIRNRMLSAVRRTMSLSQECTAGWRDPEERAAPSGDPVLLLDEREDASALHRFLKDGLTSTEYTVLVSYLNGYSYEETAAHLAVGTKTVDNALQRVRRKLAKWCLERDADG